MDDGDAANAQRVEVDLGIDGIVDPVLVGRGGFGIVYRAHQPAFNRSVAVKVLVQPFVDEASKKAFDRECQALGGLSAHPNIVTLLGAGTTPMGRGCPAERGTSAAVR